jgi:hypothetical protein
MRGKHEDQLARVFTPALGETSQPTAFFAARFRFAT